MHRLELARDKFTTYYRKVLNYAVKDSKIENSTFDS